MKFFLSAFALTFALFLHSCTPTQQASTLTPEVELVLDAKASLGEGAIWHPTEQKLYWVDIEGMSVHVYDPATNEDAVHPVGKRIGTLVPDLAGGAVVALEDGIYHLQLESDSLTFLAKPADHKPGVRFNDGKCDPSGRLWVGSMHLQQHKDSAFLYRINHDLSTERVLDKVSISNGIAWSADKKTMYYIDTPTLTVKAFDYDDASGQITHGRVAIVVPDSLGYPDGMTIDAEGKLWVAHWGGGAVIRWDPANGKMLQRILVPAPNTTSCAFGGENLETLYITSASVGVENPADFPLSGGLFAVKPGVKGVKASFFQGKLP